MKAPNHLFREQRRVKTHGLNAVFDRHPMGEPLDRHNGPPQHPVEEVASHPQDVVVHKQVAIMLKHKKHKTS